MTTPSGVCTCWSPPVAVSSPPANPSGLATRVSAVTVTDASPPAGTVTVDLSSVNIPDADGLPSGPVVFSASVSVMSAAP